MRWEWFSDRSYYDLACVRPVGERRFGCSFHLHSTEEARTLAEFLTRLDAPSLWADPVDGATPATTAGGPPGASLGEPSAPAEGDGGH